MSPSAFAVGFLRPPFGSRIALSLAIPLRYLCVWNRFPGSKPGRASRLDTHSGACGPEHLPRVPQPGELRHLLYSALLQKPLIAAHLLHLLQARHHHGTLLIEVRVTIKMRVTPHFRRIPGDILVLEPVLDPIRLCDSETCLQESPLSSILQLQGRKVALATQICEESLLVPTRTTGVEAQDVIHVSFGSEHASRIRLQRL